MARALKNHPYVSVVVVCVSLLLGLGLWLKLQPVAVGEEGPAEIYTDWILIYPPYGGGSVGVFGYVDGSADQMQVWGRSVTRDNLLRNGEPLWFELDYYQYGSSMGYFQDYIQAAYGDLIEIKARNYFYGEYHTDVELMGYVPAPSDTAPPEFHGEHLSASWSSGSGGILTVSINHYLGIYDPSYPITVALSEIDDPSNSSSVTITSDGDSFPKVLQLFVPLDTEVRLYASDNYLNGRSQIYNTSQLDLTVATGDLEPEPDQSPAERTGNQAVGGIGVQLHNGSFVHAEHLFGVRGAALELPIGAVHRSRVTSDSVVGGRWDSLLQSRIQFDGQNNIFWRPGNGRKEKFTFAFGGWIYWKSPAGMFVRLTGASGTYEFLFPDGQKYVYVSYYLREIIDRNGNKIEFIRDSYGRCFTIVDDLGRRYQLSYYDHGRLAEVVDYTGRKMRLRYSQSGDLVAIEDFAGYVRRFEYGQSRLERLFDRNDRLYLENDYGAAGETTLQTIPWGNSQKGSGTYGTYTFDYTEQSVGTVSVTDPASTVREYTFAASTGSAVGLLGEVTTKANPTLRALVGGYDWGAVPEETAVSYEYDPLNLLPSRTWKRAKEGGNWSITTPYTWYFYDSGVQDSDTVDPRSFGNLRLIREDKKINDVNREYAATRESYNYTSDFNRREKHWGPRAWIGVATSAEDRANWSSWDSLLDGSFLTVYNYETDGDLQEIVHPDVTVPATQATVLPGELTDIRDTFIHNSRGQISRHTDPKGVVTRYDYYGYATYRDGMLKSRWVDIPGTALDPRETYEPDVLGRVTARIDGRGFRWEADYDELDRVVEERTPVILGGAIATRSVYDGAHLLEVRRTNRTYTGSVPPGEPAELVTTYQYDPAAGVLVRQVDDVKEAQDKETLFEYDPLLRVARTKEQFIKLSTGEKRYRTSDVFRDELGRSVRTVEYLSDPADPSLADDVVRESYFDGRGDLVRSREQVTGGPGEPEWLETLYWSGYDDEEDPDPELRYRVSRVLQPNGTISETVVDTEAGVTDWSTRSSKLIVVGNPSQEVEVSRGETFQDELGRVYQNRTYSELGTSPVFFDTETWFDKASRTMRAYDQYTKTGLTAPYRSWEYDGAGRVEIESSPGGKHRTEYTYDQNNNVTLMTVTEVKDSGSGTPQDIIHTVTYGYDALGRRYAIFQGGQWRRYYFDTHDRVRLETFSSLGLETERDFDLAGNLIEKRRRISAAPLTWEITSYHTDLLGRELAKTTASPANPAERVSTISIRDQWGQGRLECLVLPGVCTVDPSVGEWCELDPQTVAAEDKYVYTYDLLGRRLTATDPNGTTITNVYDSEGGLLSEVQVSPAPGVGGATRVMYEYGETGGCGCGDGNLPTRVVTFDAAGACLSRVEREYNALGEVVKETVRVCDGCPTQEADPCTDPSASSQTIEYVRDDAGPAHEVTTILDPDEVLGVPMELRRIYDANGRVAEVRTNMFSQAFQTEQSVARYWYQGDGKIAESEYEWDNEATRREKMIRRASYDGGGFGNRTGNTWSLAMWNDQAEQWEEEPASYEWGATYDAANRISEKSIGPAGEAFKYVFGRDDRGRLTSTEYQWPDNPPSAEQLRDFRTVDYSWDEAGRPTGQTQCSQEADGSPLCEASPYTMVRDARGRITEVTGTHVFAYHPASTAPSREIGPQARVNDANGNVRSIAFRYSTYSAPDSCNDPPPCDPPNSRSERDHTWAFAYDAWNRIVSATKTVDVQTYHFGDGQSEPCCEEIADPPQWYSVTYVFAYDGDGRRALTDVSVAESSLGLAGVEEARYLNVFDRSGRMAQRLDLLGAGEHLTYVHGPEKMPAMGLFARAGVAPQMFLTDVEGNPGSIRDADTYAEREEKSTADCGADNPGGSGQEPQGPGATKGNAYRSSKGMAEDGCALVRDANYTEWFVGEDGELTDPEAKGHDTEDGESGCEEDYQESGERCCVSPDVEFLYKKGAKLRHVRTGAGYLPPGTRRAGVETTDLSSPGQPGHKPPRKKEDWEDISELGKQLSSMRWAVQMNCNVSLCAVDVNRLDPRRCWVTQTLTVRGGDSTFLKYVSLAVKRRMVNDQEVDDSPLGAEPKCFDNGHVLSTFDAPIVPHGEGRSEFVTTFKSSTEGAGRCHWRECSLEWYYERTDTKGSSGDRVSVDWIRVRCTRHDGASTVIRENPDPVHVIAH